MGKEHIQTKIEINSWDILKKSSDSINCIGSIGAAKFDFDKLYEKYKQNNYDSNAEIERDFVIDGDKMQDFSNIMGSKHSMHKYKKDAYSDTTREKMK